MHLIHHHPVKRALLVSSLLFGLAMAAPAPAAEPLTVDRLDGLMAAVWEENGIEPVRQAGDAMFLRRIFLDLVGEPPALAETTQFLDNQDPDKREKLIEHLLSDDRYGARRATLWKDAIVQGRILKRRLPVEGFDNYLADSFNRDRPYNQLVTELIAAEGVSSENPETFFILSHENRSEDLTGTTARLFLGTQLRCVQCHDDKFGSWKQTDFWGLAAFYARVQTRPYEKDGNRLVSVRVFDRPQGEAMIPEGGTPPNLRQLPPEQRREARRQMMMMERANPVPPSFLGKPIRMNPRADRRMALAALVTSPKTDLFPRAAVNRVWAEMFGKGLIEPVDDIYGKDAGDWEPLLRSLSDEFVRSGYSLRNLYRLIANSRAYQLASEGSDDTLRLAGDFARARLRPLAPETLFTTILKTTQLLETVPDRTPDRMIERQRRRYLERFEFAFGNDEGEQQRSFEGTIPQALMMMNDPLIERSLQPAEGSALLEIGRKTEDPEERIRLIYLAVLCRDPEDGEVADALTFFRDALGADESVWVASNDGLRVGNARRPGRRRAGITNPQVVPYQDLMWALMNTSEYLYNH